MEASALHAPALTRRPLALGLLRLRSDEQLVALFRAGSDEAFCTIHDRYRQRLFAYVRQMLSKGSRADAEDVLQDVFVRAYGALRNDTREINLRAWLYRVAHNRCIDHLRRPVPPAGEIFEMSRGPLLDPLEAAQRRDDLKRLVQDVGRLPEQQRSALLMREIDGLAYADIAGALGVTVPAVKSLLVRARVGLVEAAEARDTACTVIREDLAAACDRGVKASGRARKHMRECSGCREYRTALRSMRHSFAALTPAGFAPLALAAKFAGLGGAGGGAAVGSAAGGGAVAATACKVAAVMCTAAVATGGVVEVKRKFAPPRAAAPVGAAVAAPVAAPAFTGGSEAPAPPVIAHRTDRVVPVAEPPRAEPRATEVETTPVVSTPGVPVTEPGPVAEALPATGGTVAPAEEQAPLAAPPAEGAEAVAPAAPEAETPTAPVTPPAAEPEGTGGATPRTPGPPPTH